MSENDKPMRDGRRQSMADDEGVLPREEIAAWLRESDAVRLDELWRRADDVRRRCVGDEIHLRGLVEISNYCLRSCAYCGLRAGNAQLTRYRMTADEVLSCASRAVALGYGTIVIQSGEDLGIGRSWVEELIRRIKSETPLAVTLSLGEREPEELAAWREAGADRYLLRFETSNRDLYDRIHPARPGQTIDRMALLRVLRELGYEVGSGMMVGLPGQSYDDVADDIELFGRLDLDMIGVGPYLPHPETPLVDADDFPPLAEDRQTPATDLMAFKVVALARLAAPRANIPATTALSTLNREDGRRLALMRGANVVMPDLTPAPYGRWYEIYPGKSPGEDTIESADEAIREMIGQVGRIVGQGRGDSPNMTHRAIL